MSKGGVELMFMTLMKIANISPLNQHLVKSYLFITLNNSLQGAHSRLFITSIYKIRL